MKTTTTATAQAKTRKQQIITKYLNIAKKMRKVPSAKDCAQHGLTEKTIRYHFNDSINNLRTVARRYDTAKVLSNFKTDKEVIYKLAGVKNKNV